MQKHGKNAKKWHIFSNKFEMFAKYAKQRREKIHKQKKPEMQKKGAKSQRCTAYI